jgi:hypothetical protein
MLVIESPHVLSAQFSFRQLFRPGRATICTYDTSARPNCLCPANLAAVFVWPQGAHRSHENKRTCKFCPLHVLHWGTRGLPSPISAGCLAAGHSWTRYTCLAELIC